MLAKLSSGDSSGPRGGATTLLWTTNGMPAQRVVKTAHALHSRDNQEISQKSLARANQILMPTKCKQVMQAMMSRRLFHMSHNTLQGVQQQHYHDPLIRQGSANLWHVQDMDRTLVALLWRYGIDYNTFVVLHDRGINTIADLSQVNQNLISSLEIAAGDKWKLLLLSQHTGLLTMKRGEQSFIRANSWRPNTVPSMSRPLWRETSELWSFPRKDGAASLSSILNESAGSLKKVQVPSENVHNPTDDPELSSRSSLSQHSTTNSEAERLQLQLQEVERRRGMMEGLHEMLSSKLKVRLTTSKSKH
uniref:Uncharacterized protein n=1 Tax=Hanusia phi TaxID=3032 RepID=A0A7S0NDQ7_9CRYP|mmetsp:Transcript_7455/g.16982  ORF Transcript_7455/g.16982 Transcript_7455/m.16982 type:complete len:305 (+) Transcript_7455:119-1033(+)